MDNIMWKVCKPHNYCEKTNMWSQTYEFYNDILCLLIKTLTLRNIYAI